MNQTWGPDLQRSNVNTPSYCANSHTDRYTIVLDKHLDNFFYNWTSKESIHMTRIEKIKQSLWLERCKRTRGRLVGQVHFLQRLGGSVGACNI